MNRNAESPLLLLCAAPDEHASLLHETALRGGFAVHRARTPGEASALLRERVVRPAAALITSVGATRENVRFIESLRSADSGVPVVFLAASSDEEREAAVRRAGVQYYLLPEAIGAELPVLLDHLFKRSVRKGSAGGAFGEGRDGHYANGD